MGNVLASSSPTMPSMASPLIPDVTKSDSESKEIPNPGTIEDLHKQCMGEFKTST